MPQLEDWRVKTLKQFRPYRKDGKYDLEEYARAECGGSPLQLARARKLVQLCRAVERDLSSEHDEWDEEPEESYLDYD